MYEQVYRSFIVENSPATRLDRWVKRQFPHVTQGQIEKWLRSKDILVNGKKAESSLRVNDFDAIQIKAVIADILARQDKSPLNLEVYIPNRTDADALAACIIWEDDELLVINKPSGLATQGGTKTRHHVDLLLRAYQYHFCPKLTLRLVHRLDRDTSGVLVVAKTLKAANNLAAQFKNNTTKKVYWAISHGKPSPLHGVIDAPLIKAENVSRNGEAMIIDFKNGKSAQTTFRVVKSFQDYSWFDLRPLTGRTHQIRVHLAWHGNPIVGDGKYGDPSLRWGDEQLHLHARSICIQSVDGQMLTFTAPPPPHMVDTLSRNHINWEQYA